MAHMPRYIGVTDFEHGRAPVAGVLVSNLGTPDAPDSAAVRRYLREFLGDPRVIELPRALWWLILNLVILPLRAPRSAHAYAKVWSESGSPLLDITRRQARALQARFAAPFEDRVRVEFAMRYGKPSIDSALRRLADAGVRRLLVLPLYPQYSATTTASTFDALARACGRYRWLPELRFVTDYHDDPGYVHAVADSIRAHWAAHGRGERLLFSFHGLPRRYLLAGDPYHCQCRASARLIAAALELPHEAWQISFQSRVGREEWLRPYTDETLTALPAQGVRRVDVVCPGFSADCLETLEEIDMQNRAAFLAAGGHEFHYVAALNDSAAHIEALATLALRHMQGWPEIDPQFDAGAQRRGLEAAAARARALGAPR